MYLQVEALTDAVLANLHKPDEDAHASLLSLLERHRAAFGARMGVHQ